MITSNDCPPSHVAGYSSIIHAKYEKNLPRRSANADTLHPAIATDRNWYDRPVGHPMGWSISSSYSVPFGFRKEGGRESRYRAAPSSSTSIFVAHDPSSPPAAVHRRRRALVRHRMDRPNRLPTLGCVDPVPLGSARVRTLYTSSASCRAHSPILTGVGCHANETARPTVPSEGTPKTN